MALEQQIDGVIFMLAALKSQIGHEDGVLVRRQWTILWFEEISKLNVEIARRTAAKDMN